MKNLKYLLMGFLFLLPQSLIGAELHAILVADTLDRRQGKYFKADMEMMRKTFATIARNSGLTLRTYDVEGRNTNANYIRNVLRRVNPGNDDVVAFYYSGHGFRTVNTQRQWPNLALQGPALNSWEIFHVLYKKNPRLLLTLSDCCNSFIPPGNIPVAKAFSNTQGVNKAAYRKLFRDYHGAIIAAGCKPGEVSYTHPANGRGAFTMQFRLALSRELETTSPSWADVMRETSQTIRISQQHKPQNPIHKIYARKSKTDVVTKPDEDGKDGVLYTSKPSSKYTGYLGGNDSQSTGGKFYKTYVGDMHPDTLYVIELDSNTFDTYLQVRDSSGRVIASNDDRAKGNLNSTVKFRPNVSGRYQVAVTSYGSGKKGNYTLKVFADRKQWALSLRPSDAKDSRGHYFREHATYLYRGTTYTVTLNSNSFDTYLRVEDKSKRVLAQDDDGGPGLNSALRFTPTKSGYYWFVVTSYSAGRTGDYRLTVSP